jgi:phosphoribosylglycinamide formyltransferase-1
MEQLRLGFLASHGGSNMQAIIDAFKNGEISAIPSAVISNNSTSLAIERAKKENIPNYHLSSARYPDPDELDNAIINAFEENGVNLIILAGYMKKLGAGVIRKFKGRVLNIHPALLPKFGGEGMYGMNVHKAVIDSGEKESGPTVHIVDEIYDNGRILNQIKVPVFEEDTPESLAERVLSKEHIIYVETIKKISTGEIVL